MDTQVATPVQAFVEQLLDTGDTLVRLVENLTDAIVAAGSPADAAVSEIVEMLTGTVAVRLSSVPAADFGRAAELIELTLAAALADLHLAAELAGRSEGQNGHSGQRN